MDTVSTLWIVLAGILVIGLLAVLVEAWISSHRKKQSLKLW
jgi:hypothetical protein